MAPVTIAAQAEQLSERIWRGIPREDLVTRVATALRDQILSGSPPPGARFCGEVELARQLGVSRPTLREATRILASEGLLEIRHGAGTFVAEPHTHITGSLDSINSLSAVLKGYGAEPHVRGLKIAQVRATADIAQALDLPEGAPVASIERIRLLHNKPLTLAHEYIALTNAVPQLAVIKTFDGQSIYKFLSSALKMNMAHSETSLTAVLANKAQAALLHLKPRSPLLCMRETHFDANRKRTFYSVNYHNTAVIDFTLVRMGVQS